MEWAPLGFADGRGRPRSPLRSEGAVPGQEHWLGRSRACHFILVWCLGLGVFFICRTGGPQLNVLGIEDTGARGSPPLARLRGTVPLGRGGVASSLSGSSWGQQTGIRVHIGEPRGPGQMIQDGMSGKAAGSAPRAPEVRGPTEALASAARRGQGPSVPGPWGQAGLLWCPPSLPAPLRDPSRGSPSAPSPSFSLSQWAPRGQRGVPCHQSLETRCAGSQVARDCGPLAETAGQ